MWEFRFDLFAVFYFLGLYQTGNYAFAMGVVALVCAWGPDTVLQVMLRSFMVRRYGAREDKEGLQKFFKISTSAKLFFVIPTIVVLTVLIKPLAGVLFGAKYAGGITLFYIFAPFLLFKIMVSPLREVLIVLKRNDISFVSNWALLYKIAGIVILVPLYGIHALAFVSGSFFLIVFLVHYYFGRKVIAFEFEWGKIIKIAINTAIAMVAGIVLLRVFTKNLMGIAGVAVAMMFVYGVASYGNKVFTREERALFNEAIGRNLWVF